MTPNTFLYNKGVSPSQNRYVWFFVSATIVMVGIFFGTRIYVDYKRTISRAEERLLTQTRVIDENIATNLTVVNLMLNDVAAKLKDTSGGSQLNGYLKQQLVMTPGIRTLIITDAQGRCLYSNRDELLGKDFAKDRDYFKVPRDAPDKGILFLSPPYTTILGKYVINITKPLFGKNKEFNGIVSVTFDPEYFSALLKSTLHTADNRVSLVHGNGTVFMAMPEAKIPVTGVKVTQPGSAFLQHLSGSTPTSVRVATGKTVGDKRIFAYRTNIPKGVRFDKQIIVAASRNMHEVLDVWRMDAGIELVIYLLFASSSIVVTRVMLQRGIELKRLEETQAHLAAIVEFSDDAIISKDMSGVILSWNAGAERLFAYPPEEAVGRPITMLIPPELQEEESRILHNLAAGEPVKPFETVRTTKDGRRLNVSVTSSPLKDNTGTVIGASKIIRDITDRIQAQELLRLSEERHRILAETMLQGVVHQDASGRIVSMNPAAERILGKSRKEFLGNDSVAVERDTIRENGEVFPGMEHPTMVALRTGLPVSGVVMGVFNPILNEYRWINIDAVPVFRPGEDHPAEVYSVFADITERKQAEESLKKLNKELDNLVKQRTDELREKDKVLLIQSRQAAMGEMIGNIAHQWRQPINTLGLVVQQLLLFYDMGKFSRELLEKNVTVSRNIIEHLSTTIDDFRNFFRPDKEKVEFKVTEAIAGALSLVEEGFKNRQIAVDVVAKNDPAILGYRNEYGQVILNLLNNARDALTDRGPEDPRVTITIDAEENRTVVTVADNAGGILEEIMDKIFDPYFTTKGPQQGTGIGLFMSKTIIEKNMGGRLSARNTVDGAEFRIEV